MIVLVVELDESRAALMAERLVAAGHQALSVRTEEEIRAHLRTLSDAVAVLLSPRAPLELAAAAAKAGVPMLMIDEGSGVPGTLLQALHRTGSVSVVPPDLGSGELSERLEAAVAWARWRTQADCAESALRHAGAAILVADRDGIVQRANAAFARLSGGPARDPAGSPLAEILGVSGDAERVARFEEACRGVAPWTGDAMLVTGGARLRCRATLSQVVDYGERVTGVVAVLVDVAGGGAHEGSQAAADRGSEARPWLDPLTGLHRRGYLLDVLERELGRAQRRGYPVAALALDLDRFRSVKERLGFAEGDRVLRSVARALKHGLRKGDILARTGGNEFCAILPFADHLGVQRIADRMRMILGLQHFGSRGTLTLTASIGVTAADDVDSMADAVVVGLRLLSVANEALLVAQRAGGNRVVFMESSV